MRLVLATALALATSAAHAAVIRGSVVANGGNSSTPASNGVHRVLGTAGQPAVGVSASAARIVCAGFWCFGGSRVVDVPPPGDPAPAAFALGPAMPNPARGATRFRLALPKEARVTLAVYDVGGRQVGEVVERDFGAGVHDLAWSPPNGRAGLYFVKLATDAGWQAKRTVVVVH